MKQKVTGGKPIPAEQSMVMFNEVKQLLQDTFELPDGSIIPLGSTGKKPKGQTCGDIDIAIDSNVLKYVLKEYDDFELRSTVYHILASTFPNVIEMRGIDVISFMYPIPESKEYGQVDIMLSDDLELSNFFYHSPNFILKESKYKGMYRNQLIFAVMSVLNTHMAEDVNEEGEIINFWKWSLTAHKGLFLMQKTYQGNRGRIKNPKRLEGSKDMIIASDPRDIVKCIFGNDCELEDVVSFESVYKIITSPTFNYVDRLDEILTHFKTSLVNLKLELPKELK